MDIVLRNKTDHFHKLVNGLLNKQQGLHNYYQAFVLRSHKFLPLTKLTEHSALYFFLPVYFMTLWGKRELYCKNKTSNLRWFISRDLEIIADKAEILNTRKNLIYGIHLFTNICKKYFRSRFGFVLRKNYNCSFFITICQTPTEVSKKIEHQILSRDHLKIREHLLQEYVGM